MYGLNPEDIKNIGDIKDPNNGETIATAKHDTVNNLITYTFTDYVDRFNSVKWELITQFIWMQIPFLLVKTMLSLM